MTSSAQKAGIQAAEHSRRSRLATWFSSAAWVPRLPSAVITTSMLLLLPVRELLETQLTLLLAPALLAATLLAWTSARAALLRTEGIAKMVVIQHAPGLLLASLLLPVSWKSLPVVWACYQVAVLLEPWPVGALRRAAPSATGLVLSACLAGLWANLASRTVLMVAGF